MGAERRGAVERVAAQIVTGPVAFLLAGAIDVSVFTRVALRQARAARLEDRRRARSGGSTIGGQ